MKSYSLAQIGSRESTGYLRTVEVPASVQCTFPSSFTGQDKARVQELNSGRLSLQIIKRASASQVALCDAMGRKVTLRKVKAGWNWSETSAKGKLSGRVANPLAFQAWLARNAR